MIASIASGLESTRGGSGWQCSESTVRPFVTCRGCGPSGLQHLVKGVRESDFRSTADVTVYLHGVVSERARATECEIWSLRRRRRAVA